MYDYEIEYFIESDGGVEIDGVYTPFEPGSINFRRPGQKVCGIYPYKCICICIDILGNCNKLSDYYLWGSPEASQSDYSNEILRSIPNKLSPLKTEKACKLITDIYTNYTIGNGFAVKTLLYELIFELYSISINEHHPDSLPPHVSRALDYIQHNYDLDITVQNIADNVSLSASHLHSLFKRYLGITPCQYLTNLRIEKAKQLLYVTNLSISEIGCKCGIFDAVYFSYWFKENTGLTPRQFRNR